MFIVRNSRRGTPALLAAVGATGLCLGTSVAHAQNLLRDPGFEPDTATGLPSAAGGDQPTNNVGGPDTVGPWEGYNTYVPPYAAYYSAAVNHTPGGSQAGKTFGGSMYAGGIFQSANLVPGEAYSAQVWFYDLAGDAINAAGNDGQAATLQLTFYTGANASGTNLYTVSAPAFTGLNADGSTNQNTWVEETITTQAISIAQSVQFAVNYTNPSYAGGAVYVDDAALIDTTFNGGGTTNNFSDAGNWNGVAPGPYSPLVFGRSSRTSIVNDTPAGTPYYGINFTANASSYTITGNELNLASNVTNLSANSQTIGVALGLQQDTTFNSANGAMNISGSIAGTFALIKAGNFPLILAGSNAYTNGTSVQAGMLLVANANALGSGGGLSISAGASVKFAIPGAPAAVVLPSLGVSGQLDLGTDALVLPGAELTATTQLVQAGYNNGAWNGTTGIMSSAAASSSKHLTAVGVISNDNGKGIALFTTFDGATTNDGDILVKYTYYGDTNLDGKVDGSDYSRIDNAFANNKNSSNTQLTGWFNGDFNYDGVVNGSDYTLIDNAFNAQGTQLAASVASQVGAAVPEPATLGLLAMTSLAFLGRSRRNR